MLFRNHNLILVDETYVNQEKYVLLWVTSTSSLSEELAASVFIRYVHDNLSDHRILMNIKT